MVSPFHIIHSVWIWNDILQLPYNEKEFQQRQETIDKDSRKIKTERWRNPPFSLQLFIPSEQPKPAPTKKTQKSLLFFVFDIKHANFAWLNNYTIDYDFTTDQQIRRLQGKPGSSTTDVLSVYMPDCVRIAIHCWRVFRTDFLKITRRNFVWRGDMLFVCADNDAAECFVHAAQVEMVAGAYLLLHYTYFIRCRISGILWCVFCMVENLQFFPNPRQPFNIFIVQLMVIISKWYINDIIPNPIYRRKMLRLNSFQTNRAIEIRYL